MIRTLHSSSDCSNRYVINGICSIRVLFHRHVIFRVVLSGLHTGVSKMEVLYNAASIKWPYTHACTYSTFWKEQLLL